MSYHRFLVQSLLKDKRNLEDKSRKQSKRSEIIWRLNQAWQIQALRIIEQKISRVESELQSILDLTPNKTLKELAMLAVLNSNVPVHDLPARIQLEINYMVCMILKKNDRAKKFIDENPM